MQPPTCHRCGVKGHSPDRCRHRDKVCHKCEGRGHLARVCQSKPLRQAQTKRQAAKTRTRTKSIRQAEEVDPEDSDESLDNIREVKQSKAPPIKVPNTIDGVRIQMEVMSNYSTKAPSVWGTIAQSKTSWTRCKNI